MLGYLSRMSDRMGTVTPSESARRILAKYRERKSNFSAKHSRPPILHEMAEQMDIPLEKLVPIIQMSRPIASLDTSTDDGATPHELLSNNSGSPSETIWRTSKKPSTKRCPASMRPNILLPFST
jgi:DNA-directed RNA polymerase sigma subunit (sigma70/sigma32)